MFFIYVIPILPVLFIILAMVTTGAAWIHDALPVLCFLLVAKNIYVDLYCSIRKSSHTFGAALLQFFFGLIRIAVFSPIIGSFINYSGGLSGLIDLVISVIFIVPVISFLWLFGELSSLAYGVSNKAFSAGKAIISNIISIVCALGIYLFFFL